MKRIFKIIDSILYFIAFLVLTCWFIFFMNQYNLSITMLSILLLMVGVLLLLVKYRTVLYNYPEEVIERKSPKEIVGNKII